MTQLAIKGHAIRSKEVIEVLRMLGGFNPFAHVGSNPLAIYYIDKNCSNFIICSDVNKNCDCTVLTLEEFLEKFPYKVGDKVKAWVNEYCGVFNIQDMTWDSIAKEVKYRIHGYWYSAENLQPCKEETMDRKYNVEEYIEVWKETEKGLEVVVNDRFELKEDNGKFYIIKKQPQYSKTYEECCRIIPSDPNFYVDTHLYSNKLESLYKLLICRDAYWKIAGEQMGLGKTWTPDWNVDSKTKYVILYKNNSISKEVIVCRNNILAFPTAEMRDAFYENFKELIEECKEFL